MVEVEALYGIALQYVILFSAYAIIALSFNLEYGFAGIPNFGKVLFVSLGAYTFGAVTAWVVVSRGSEILGVEIEAAGEPAYCAPEAKYIFSRAAVGEVLSFGELALLIGVASVAAFLVAAVGGVIASYPAVRLRGDFLAIMLLAMGEIVRLVAYNSPWPVCSFDGLSGIPSPFAVIGFEHALGVAVSSLALALLVYLYVSTSTNSPWGRILKSVRDDEIAASIYGYNPAVVRLKVLAVGSGLAGLGGVLLVLYTGNVNAISFKPDRTFEVIAAVMLGGSANNVGAVLGAAIIVLLLVFLNPTALQAIGIDLPANIGQALPYFKFAVIGLIIIAVLMFRPQGVLPERPLKTPLIKRLARRVG